MKNYSRVLSYQSLENIDLLKLASEARRSGGRVVKLLACGARGPGFDSRPHHLNFQRLVISCFQVEIRLKDRVNSQNNQPNQPASEASQEKFWKKMCF